MSGEVKVLNCGWEVKYILDEPLFLSSSVVKDGEALLKKWQEHFSREETFVQKRFGIPSLFVRIDGVTTEKEGSRIMGVWRIYEIEERPAGLGLCTLINVQFKEKLLKLRDCWPSFLVVISPLRKGFDDHLWVGQNYVIVGGPDIVPANNTPLLIRAEPEEEAYSILSWRCISTFKKKGCKAYGEALGWWKRVSINEINWDVPFVLKPLQGSKTKGVHIWYPSRKKEHGCSTKSQILRTFEVFQEMYLQEWIEPFRSKEGHYLILRVFYGWNPQEERWECLGGLWNSRPNLIVHGSTDSVFGPIYIEE